MANQGFKKKIKRGAWKIYWRVLRLARLERRLWNGQYVAGRWERSDRPPRTLELVAQLCAGGRLVELGCGEASVPRQLPAGAFSDYMGVDISDVAISRARAQTAEAGVRGCTFLRADIANWEGTRDATLILAEECLYYLDPSAMRSLLDRCLTSLAPGGSILAVVHDADKHARTLDICRQAGVVLAEEDAQGVRYVRIRPPPSPATDPSPRD